MNKKFYLAALVIVTMALTTWLLTHRSSNKELGKQHHSTIALEDVEISKTPIRVDFSKTQEPYKRPKLKRPALRSDFSQISFDLSDKDALRSVAESIKNRSLTEKSDFNFKEKTLWDLNNDLPQSSADYQLMLKESVFKGIDHFINSALNDDLAGMQKAAAGIYGVEIFKAFEFVGYDKNGKLILNLPVTETAHNPMEKSDSKTASVNKETSSQRKISSEQPVPATVQKDEDKLLLEALFAEKLEQTPFFADHETNKKAMKEYYGTDGSIFGGISKAVDFTIEFISRNKLFLMTPENAFQGVKKNIAKVVEESNVFPDRYGTHGLTIKDVSDLDYDIFAQSVASASALTYALIASGLATAVGDRLLDTLKGAHMYALGMFAYFTVEAFVAALGSYWGTYRLIMLHRYQNYIRDAKEFTLSRGKDFQINRIKPFDPNIVFYSRATRMEMNKSWIWGFLAGRSVSKFVVLSSVQWLSLRLVAISIPLRIKSTTWLGKMVSTITRQMLQLRMSEKAALQLLNLSSLVAGKRAKVIKRFIKRKLKHKLLQAAVIFADFSISSYFIYTSIYTRLHATTKMLDRVYYSPEVAVYLANTDPTNETYKPFKEASREFFYPFCHYIATSDINMEKVTYATNPIGESDINKDIKLRRANCLKLIAAFEGVPEVRAKDHMQRLVTEGKLDERLFHLYFTEDSEEKLVNQSISEEVVIELLRKVHLEEPDYYRTTWIAALQSVYNLHELPDQFTAYKNILVTGKGGDLYENQNSYFDFDVLLTAEKVNIHRFNYIIERIAYKIKSRKDFVNKEKSEETPESIFIEANLDLTEAFVTYWNYHSKNTDTIDQDLDTLLSQQDKGFFARVWDGVKSAGAQFKIIFSRVVNPPYKNTARYKAEQEIESDKFECFLESIFGRLTPIMYNGYSQKKARRGARKTKNRCANY